MRSTVVQSLGEVGACCCAAAGARSCVGAAAGAAAGVGNEALCMPRNTAGCAQWVCLQVLIHARCLPEKGMAVLVGVYLCMHACICGCPLAAKPPPGPWARTPQRTFPTAHAPADSRCPAPISRCARSAAAPAVLGVLEVTPVVPVDGRVATLGADTGVAVTDSMCSPRTSSRAAPLAEDVEGEGWAAAAAAAAAAWRAAIRAAAAAAAWAAACCCRRMGSSSGGGPCKGRKGAATGCLSELGRYVWWCAALWLTAAVGRNWTIDCPLPACAMA